MSIPDSVSIPHPAKQRSRGYLLTGYLVFCTVRGGLQDVAGWSLIGHPGASAEARTFGLTLASLGALNVLGAIGAWRWSWPGAVLLAAAAGGTVVVGRSAGLGLSVALGVAMLVASAVMAFAVPWRLSCLRCRAPVSRSDAACPSCGQRFE